MNTTKVEIMLKPYNSHKPSGKAATLIFSLLNLPFKYIIGKINTIHLEFLYKARLQARRLITSHGFSVVVYMVLHIAEEVLRTIVSPSIFCTSVTYVIFLLPSFIRDC